MIVPIFKEKEDIQEFGNYRSIKMISNTMKISERIIDRRLREETSIGEEQFGFMRCLLTLRRRMTGYRGRKFGGV